MLMLDCEIELVLARFRITGILAAALGQQTQQLDFVAVEEWQDAVVQQIGRRHPPLAVIELGKRNLGVGMTYQ